MKRKPITLRCRPPAAIGNLFVEVLWRLGCFPDKRTLESAIVCLGLMFRPREWNTICDQCSHWMCPLQPKSEYQKRWSECRAALVQFCQHGPAELPGDLIAAAKIEVLRDYFGWPTETPHEEAHHQ